MTERLWEVRCDAVETVAFSLDGRGPSSYPLPALRTTAESRQVEFEAVVVENGLISATVVPRLGGRILALSGVNVDKVLWPLPEHVSPDRSGTRGLRWSAGMTAWVGSSDDSGLAPLAYRTFPPQKEDSSGGVMTFAMDSPAVDWHACTTLEPGRADLLVELKVHNRSLTPCRCPVGLRIDVSERPTLVADRHIVWSPSGHGPGLALWSEGSVLTVVDEGALSLGPSPEGVFFGPRQSRTYRIRIMPLLDGGLSGFEDGLVAGRDGRKVWALSSTGFTGSAQVLCVDGAALQAPLDLEPGVPFHAELGPEVAELAVVDHQGHIRIDSRVTVSPRPRYSEPESEVRLLAAAREYFRPLAPPAESPENTEASFWSNMARGDVPDAGVWGLEAVLELQRAKTDVARGAFESAVGHIDQALLFQGDDPLLWWFRAACERRAGLESEEDRTALLNGRFLAPLDPVFRAEAFLSSTTDAALGPSPLLRPLAEDPVHLLDIADLYVGHGLTADAVRLLDEALRIRACPLARYVLAWCLGRSPQTEAEVPALVREASAMGVVPPLPCRIVECKAVLDLAASFPGDPVLAQWAGLVRAYVFRMYGSAG